jgi:LysM repeat protein
MPGLASNCNKFHQVASGDGCNAIEQAYDISPAQFLAWNSQVDTTCNDLWLGYYVCVGVPGSSPATKTTTTTKAKPTTTSATPTGPSPQMPSITSSCDKYYQVQSGDGCYSIEQAKGITSAQFLRWNPYVDADCDNLWLGYYVCVGL